MVCCIGYPNVFTMVLYPVKAQNMLSGITIAITTALRQKCMPMANTMIVSVAMLKKKGTSCKSKFNMGRMLLLVWWHLLGRC